MTGRRISGQEQAKLYWSLKAGAKAGEVHPTVSQAVMAANGEALCVQAWARVRDKQDDARNGDLERAVPLRNPAAYFVWTLQELLKEHHKQRRMKGLRDY